MVDRARSIEAAEGQEVQVGRERDAWVGRERLRGPDWVGRERDAWVGREVDSKRPSQRVRRSHGRRPGAPAQPPPLPAVPSPYEAPGQWDTLTIAGVLFLGLVRVSGATGNAIDVKKHKGRDGGRISDSGAKAAELTLHFRIWDRETWASWDQVFAAIDPQRTVERRSPVDVSHPALAQRRIGRVYVKEVSIPERQSGGEWHAEAKVIQWLPSMTDRRGRSVTRTPTAAAGADGIGSRATAFTGLTEASEGGGDGDAVADPAATDTGP